MKKLLLIALLFTGFTCVFGQYKKHINDLYIDEVDSASIAQGLIPVEYAGLFLPKKRYYGAYKLPAVIDNDSLLKAYGEFTKQNLDSFDISNYIIVHGYFGGDCMVRFIHRLYTDTVNKKLKWTIYNVWGGCRAGGGKYFAFKVPRPIKGYAVEIEEILVERLYTNGEVWDRYK